MTDTNLVADPDLQQTIDGFVDAFNRNDLDAAMRCFAEDAVYFPGDGVEAHGIEAIRKTFEPQFAGVWGQMRYDEHDRLLDQPARKLAIRWTCRMDLTQASFYSLSFWFMRFAATLSAGSRRVCWEGLDVFHFDPEGKIIGKFTYANYPFPKLKKDPRPPMRRIIK
jgi:hypothetical protein